jgi:uncharacterized RDD family membrane protein YckC
MSFSTASTWRRLWAQSIDSAAVFVLMLPILFQSMFHFFTTGLFSASVKLCIFGFILQFLYKWIFLKLFGGTPAKLLFGLRVVDIDERYSQLGWGQSFLRVLADHLSLFFGWAPFALALFSSQRRHLSDWIASTKVVQRSSSTERHKVRWVLGAVLTLFLFVRGIADYRSFISTVELRDGQITLKMPNMDPSGDFF